MDVLGVRVSAVDMSTALATIESWIGGDHRHYVCVTGVHGVMESQKDTALREIHNRAGLTTPDGMPMVWASRWAGASWVSRVYGPDLMLASCERGAALGWRMFFYGGAPGVPERLAGRLGSMFPGLQVAGTFSPPFSAMSPLQEEETTRRINDARPDIVWVGLSTPKQEKWMAVYRPALQAPVLVGVGAAFDIHAGLLSQAPAVLQDRGLEWLYRLYREPRRLWRRYLYNNPRFLLRIVSRPPTLLEP